MWGWVSLSETKTITGIKLLRLEKLIEGKIGQVKDTPTPNLGSGTFGRVFQPKISMILRLKVENAS